MTTRDQSHSDPEDQYFKQKELAQLRRKRLETSGATEEEERLRLKELHWMRCPKCGMELDEIDFKGVKVDHCFSCGGMFLDKGEIEKVIVHKEPGFWGRVIKTLSRPEDLGKT